MKILEGLSILVVDDEPDLREILKDEFEFLGAKVFDAENGRLAFKIFQNSPVDVIVSDIRMPGGDGIELLDAVRATHKTLPIVLFITGFSDLSLEDAYAKGVNAIFSKPFKIEAITQSIQNLVGSTSERWSRKCERLPLQVVVELELPDLSECIQTSLINIGQGGMFIKIDGTQPAVGTTIDFKLHFQSDRIRLLQGKGIVRWSRTVGDNEFPAGVGLEFVQLESQSVITLLRVIDELRPLSFIPKS